jgi:hypothetical protein
VYRGAERNLCSSDRDHLEQHPRAAPRQPRQRLGAQLTRTPQVAQVARRAAAISSGCGTGAPLHRRRTATDSTSAAPIRRPRSIPSLTMAQVTPEARPPPPRLVPLPVGDHRSPFAPPVRSCRWRHHQVQDPVPVTPQPGLKIAPACEPVSAAETLGRPFSCPGRGPQDHEQLLTSSSGACNRS